MEAQGKIVDVSRELTTNKVRITFVINELPSALDALTGCDALDITAKRHREKRSLNANALFWKCIGDISSALRTDKWDVYLMMLKRYGIYTYLCVKPDAVEMMKRMWRESEVIGTVDINGETAVQMLCYYGSSTYDTKQFSVLLDGVIDEMKHIGLETPTSEQMRQSLDEWERAHKLKGRD